MAESTRTEGFGGRGSSEAGSAPPIRAVLFDVDGTLYDARALRWRLLPRLLALPLRGPRRARRVLRNIQSYRRALEELRQAPRSGEPLDRAHLRRAAELAGTEMDDIAATVAEWMERRPLPLLRACRRPGLLELLAGLRDRGLEVGFFSDYPVEQKLDSMAVRGFGSLFLHAALPGIGAYKPAPDGFLFAAERWRLDPAEILYVGDRPEVDGIGATRAGMRCAIMDGRGDPGVGIPFPDFRRLARFLEENS